MIVRERDRVVFQSHVGALKRNVGSGGQRVDRYVQRYLAGQDTMATDPVLTARHYVLEQVQPPAAVDEILSQASFSMEEREAIRLGAALRVSAFRAHLLANTSVVGFMLSIGALAHGMVVHKPALGILGIGLFLASGMGINRAREMRVRVNRQIDRMVEDPAAVAFAETVRTE